MKAIIIASMLVGAAAAPRTIEISVTRKGFEPARVRVKKGEPLHLVVTRKTEDTCATELIIAAENLSKDLPLNQPVVFDFTPTKTGEVTYACGMGMVTGVLLVQ